MKVRGSGVVHKASMEMLVERKTSPTPLAIKPDSLVVLPVA
jgi:hypothetical protein